MYIKKYTTVTQNPANHTAYTANYESLTNKMDKLNTLNIQGSVEQEDARVQNPQKQTKQFGSRPIALKMPEKKRTCSEVSEDMIEWHGITLYSADCKSPITPSHWTRRIKDPLIRLKYDNVIKMIDIIRKQNKLNTKWSDMQATEFMPNLYLGSCHDVFELKYNARVSILDDFSMFHFTLDEEKISDAMDGSNGSGGITALEIHASDDGETNIMLYFNQVRDFLDKQPDDNIKIMHCVAGMNRSATLAVAYYMYKTKLSMFDALQHMVTLRPIILNNESFLKQLVIWAYDNGHLDFN